MAAITGRGIDPSASNAPRKAAVMRGAAPGSVNSDTSAPAASAFSLPVTTTALTPASAASAVAWAAICVEQRGGQRVQRWTVEPQQRHAVAPFEMDESVGHAIWRSRRSRGHACGRAALLPPSAEERRGRVERLLELFVHRVGDGLDGVETDEIGERQRPHRVRATLDHAGVDVVGRREPRLEHADRREHVGHEQEVHDEAGAVVRADDPLVEPSGDELLDPVDGVLARDDRRDELDEALHRHRVEEVQTEHVLGAAGGHRELHDRDRRRVRSDDGIVVLEDLVDVA